MLSSVSSSGLVLQVITIDQRPQCWCCVALGRGDGPRRSRREVGRWYLLPYPGRLEVNDFHPTAKCTKPLSDLAE